MTLEYEVIPWSVQMRGKLVNHGGPAHFPGGFSNVTRVQNTFFLRFLTWGLMRRSNGDRLVKAGVFRWS